MPRLLTNLLIALLLAIAVLLLGYAGMLAVRRAVRSGAPAPQYAPLRAAPAAPQPLPRVTDWMLPTAAAAPATATTDDWQLAIQLLRLPDGLDPERAGIALFGRDSGAGFQFHPLASLGNEQVLQTTTNLEEAIRVTFAVDIATARHSYLARCDLPTAREDRQRADRQTASWQLDCAAAVLQWQGPQSPAGSSPVGSSPAGSSPAASNGTYGPLLLQRVDDPDWRPPQPFAWRGETATSDAPTANSMWLGHGNYLLQDPLAPERMLTFRVPHDEPLDLSPFRAPLRADRP